MAVKSESLNNDILSKLSHVRSLVFPKGDGEVFLFGSHARGDYREDSDWDILVLTPQNINTQQDFDLWVSPFAELGWILDIEINPIQYSKQDWNQKKGSEFYYNVMKDAIKI